MAETMYIGILRIDVDGSRTEKGASFALENTGEIPKAGEVQGLLDKNYPDVRILGSEVKYHQLATFLDFLHNKYGMKTEKYDEPVEYKFNEETNNIRKEVISWRTIKANGDVNWSLLQGVPPAHLLDTKVVSNRLGQNVTIT